MPDDAVDRANGADEDTVPNGTRSHDSQMDRSVSSSGMSKREKWYTVSLLTLTAAMLYADQNLLAPNLSAAAEEFGFSEREKDVKLGGWLQLAFFVVGSPASLVIGWLADKPSIPRTRLFFFTVLIGEGPCLATYWVKTYWQLFAVRAMTGIAVGGCLPLLFSLCGDLFPPEERNIRRLLPHHRHGRRYRDRADHGGDRRPNVRVEASIFTRGGARDTPRGHPLRHGQGTTARVPGRGGQGTRDGAST